MIYEQSPLIYLLTIVTSIGLCRRLMIYLKKYLDPSYALMVAISIILHPLSLDGLLGPNLTGLVSFWLLLETIFLWQEDKTRWALLLSLVGTVLNISYSLFPLYYFYKINMKERKKYLLPALIYLFLLGLFFAKLAHTNPHNPVTFMSHLFLNVILPVGLSNFTSSLSDFSLLAFIGSLFLVLIIYLVEKKEKKEDFLMAFIFLPIIGSLVHQWTRPYSFWSEVIFTGSDYLVVTFAILALTAFYIPKRWYALLFCFLMFCSYNWGILWTPYSKVLKESVLNLPENYKGIMTARRTLALQLLQEGKFLEGSSYLKGLAKAYPEDPDIKKDLELLKKKN